jgi:hypothetical protein
LGSAAQAKAVNDYCVRLLMPGERKSVGPRPRRESERPRMEREILKKLCASSRKYPGIREMARSQGAAFISAARRISAPLITPAQNGVKKDKRQS